MKVPRDALTALANMSMRGLGLVGRFCLMIYLARFVGVEAVGQFGLIYGVVAILPAVAGFGLNFGLNREVIGAPLEVAGALIRDRLSVTLTVFLLLALVTITLHAAGMGPSVSNLVLLCAIAVGEGIAFDVHMSLVSLKLPLFANFLLFVRTSSWIYPFVALGYVFPSFRDFDTLLWFWAGALILTFVSLAVGLRNWPWRQIAARRVDVRRLGRNISSSWLIYLSDLGIVGSNFLDRFVLGACLGIAETGIFTFYWSLANAVQLLVNAAIVQVSLPRLVEASRQNESALAEGIRTEMRKVTIVGLLMGVVIFTAMQFAVPLLQRPSLAHQSPLFVMMLIAAVIRLLSDVANYGLYARGLDRAWSLTNLLGVVLSLVYTLIGLYFAGLFGVGCAMCATAASLLAVRLWVLARAGIIGSGRMAALRAIS